jgi:SAM-dependent methyltransferase
MGETSREVYGMDPSRTEDYDELQIEVIRQRWGQKAERWDTDLAKQDCHLNEDGAYDRFLTEAEAVIAERAKFCRRSALVDLGCGTGQILAHFIDRFASGVGVDISPEMLAVAARRQLPRTRLVTGNCFDLASEVLGGGAVLSRGILLSHYGPRRAPLLLEQIRRCLIPEGFALIDFLNASARHLYPSNPTNKAYFEGREIRQMARDAGFTWGIILGEPNRRVLMLLAEMGP